MKRRTKARRSNRQKTKLGLPDLEHVKSAVLVSLRSPESQRSYRRSIDDFVCWYCSEPRLSFKSADGRMATEAARLERKESTGRKKKTERKNILIRKKKKNILDTHRPSYGSRHLSKTKKTSATFWRQIMVSCSAMISDRRR
jgi:hypothetical protein